MVSPACPSHIKCQIMQISESAVLDALRYVEDPDLKKDLVSLGMIRDLKISDLHVSFTVMLTTPACPMKDLIHKACVNAITQFVNPKALVEVKMDAEVIQKKGQVEGGRGKEKKKTAREDSMRSRTRRYTTSGTETPKYLEDRWIREA